MKKVDTRILKTKEAFHQAFFLLLQETPFEEMTISMICKEAGINRGTFYRHYETKDVLFEEVIEKISDDLIQAYYIPYEANPKLTPETLDSTTIGIFQHIFTYRDFYRIVFAKESSIHLHTVFFDKFKELMLDIIAFQTKEQIINPELFASYHAYSIIGMIIEWVNNDFNYTVEYMNEQFIQILNISAQQKIAPSTVNEKNLR
ncbi:MAG: TetR/AcrR family transcriptional regulator [Kurthia sp.]|nr:TetR/AcrR family transcriptional regulator [Candidatus Kurthia equi]